MEHQEDKVLQGFSVVLECFSAPFSLKLMKVLMALIIIPKKQSNMNGNKNVHSIFFRDFWLHLLVLPNLLYHSEKSVSLLSPLQNTLGLKYHVLFCFYQLAGGMSYTYYHSVTITHSPAKVLQVVKNLVTVFVRPQTLRRVWKHFCFSVSTTGKGKKK